MERDKGFLIKGHKEALAECEEIYQLKFGERHGQEVLDSLEPTPKLKALQKEFEKEEKITVRKIQEAEKELKDTKQELLAIKKKNTKIINYITKKGNQQLELNKNLDSSNNEVTVRFTTHVRKKTKTTRRVMSSISANTLKKSSSFSMLK